MRWIILLTLLIAGCAAQPTVKPAHPPLADALLDNLVGRWSIDRAIRGQILPNEMEAHWVLGHQFVQLHMTDPKSPPQYEAIVLIGFDPSKSRYVAHWCDVFGAGASSVGYGVRTGDSIEFRFAYDDGPFFNTFTWHPAERSWTFRGESGRADGSRTLFMEDTARRR